MLNIVNLFRSRPFHLTICRMISTKLKVPANDKDYFVWIDLEMTGLDVEIHKIVEIACILTDVHLNTLHDGIHLITHQPKHVFENECSPWARNHHTKTGLLEASLNSKVTTEGADMEIANYIKAHTNYEKNKVNYFLAGNSVYMDKKFLEKYMPNVNSILNYRLIDVSTVKSLCSAWYPKKFKSLVSKKYDHRALSDIRESIMELKIYKENFFCKTDP